MVIKLPDYLPSKISDLPFHLHLEKRSVCSLHGVRSVAAPTRNMPHKHTRRCIPLYYRLCVSFKSRLSDTVERFESSGWCSSLRFAPSLTMRRPSENVTHTRLRRKDRLHKLSGTLKISTTSHFSFAMYLFQSEYESTKQLVINWLLIHCIRPSNLNRPQPSVVKRQEKQKQSTS